MHKRKILILIFSITIICAFFLADFFRHQYVPPILMYHMVYPEAERRYRPAITVKTFQRQMNFLKRHHYNVLSLEALVNLIKEKRNIPPRTVAITFDDGYKDNFIYAFPILKKHNFPVTIFVIVGEVGKNPQKLNWDEIKRMQDSGLVTFGSHTLGTQPLTNIESFAEVKRQIYDSKRIIEEKLTKRIDFFSYPEGFFNAKIRQSVIDAGYKAAVATKPGRDYPDDDIFALKRLRISENDSSLFIFAVKTSGFYTFMKEYKKKHGKR